MPAIARSTDVADRQIATTGPAARTSPRHAAPPGVAPQQGAQAGPRTSWDDGLGLALRACVARRAEMREPVLQRDDDDQAVKQKRRSRAQKTIALLGTNLDKKLDDHLFKAFPADGKPVNKDDPVGLHAYTGGGMPPGIAAGVVTGNVNKVHSLNWHWTDHATTKDSTMFPVWMPETHVRTLIALQFPDKRADRTIAATDLAPSDAKTYITRGTSVKLKLKDATVYPEI
jgi:hypothetical protein